MGSTVLLIRIPWWIKKNPFSQAQTSKSDPGGRPKWQAFPGAVQHASRLECVGVRHLPHLTQGHKPRPKCQLLEHHSLILTLGPGISTPWEVPTTLPCFSKRATKILWPHLASAFYLTLPGSESLLTRMKMKTAQPLGSLSERPDHSAHLPLDSYFGWMAAVPALEMGAVALLCLRCFRDVGSIGIAFCSRPLYPGFAVSFPTSS